MARKILYFIAGIEPTAGEAAQIENIVGDVQIRSNTQPALYGSNLEPADGLAGTIPAAYKTASGGTVIDTEDYPLGDVTPTHGTTAALIITPAAGASIAANGGTSQLRAVRAVLDEDTGTVTLSEVTGSCAWTSGTPGKATVGASTGLVTGANAGAGSSVVTASYDPADGDPITSSVTITVT